MIMRKNSIILIVVNVVALAILAGVVLYAITPKTGSSPGAKEQTAVYHCPMHPNYLSYKQVPCPICGMDLVTVNTTDPGDTATGNGTGIKIDPAMIQSSGIQTEKAAVRSLTRDIRTSATVMPDERRIKIITTKIMGYVETLHVDYTGQQVKKGQPLYEIYSPELVTAQSEYLQMYRSVLGKDSGQLLQSARQRLRNWDVTDEQIAGLEKRGLPQKTLTVFSPLSGLVAEKMVVEGQSIEAGMQLYKMIDYSKVWVEGALYQQDVPYVCLGQQAYIELDYFPGRKFRGTVSYIAPEMNMESRTLMVRLVLANTTDLRIKPGMNASMVINALVSNEVVTVSEQAVIHSGLRTLVVLAKGDGYFEPREVRTGKSAGGYTEIIDGVLAGDAIVVSSQFLIDSESNLKTAVMNMNRGAIPDSKENASSDTAGGNSTTMERDSGNVHQHSDHAVKRQDDGATAPVYICPMCPEIASDKPVSCPKCKMKLVLKKP